MLRDLNVFATTKSNHRMVLEQLKQLAISNNTAGASIFDLGNILKSESISEVTHILKAADEKAQAARQQEMQQQQQMQEQQIQAKLEEERMKMEFEASENDKDRQNKIIEAQIKAAGYGSMADVNKNMQSDYQDALADIRKQDEYRERMGLEREKETNRMINSQQQASLKQQEIAAKERIAQKQVEVARINKNKYDAPSKKTKE